MPHVIYDLSYKRISNRARRALDKAAIGKKPGKCFTHFDHESKTLLIGTPYSMNVSKKGNTVARLTNLASGFADYVAPITMGAS